MFLSCGCDVLGVICGRNTLLSAVCQLLRPEGAVLLLSSAAFACWPTTLAQANGLSSALKQCELFALQFSQQSRVAGGVGRGREDSFVIDSLRGIHKKAMLLCLH